MGLWGSGGALSGLRKRTGVTSRELSGIRVERQDVGIAVVECVRMCVPEL